MANENIIMNEGVIDAVAQAAEAVPVKAKGKLGVIGAVVFVGGAIITGVALGIRKHNKKKAEKQQAASGVDNMDVVKHDFEECDSENENE